MKRIIVSLLCSFILILSPAASAQISTPSAEISFTQELVNPDSFFYPVKRLWEKAVVYLSSFNKNQSQKIQKNLSQVRLKELMYIAQNKKYTEFKDAASRYVTEVQSMIDSKNLPTDEDKKNITEQIGNLKQLQQKYSDDYAYWSFLQQAIEISQTYLSQAH